MRPVHRADDAVNLGGVQKRKQVCVITGGALETQISEQLILRTEHLRNARLDSVLVCRGQQRNLIIVGLARRKIRQRKVVQQGSRLRADAIGWDDISRKWKTRCRVDNRTDMG